MLRASIEHTGADYNLDGVIGDGDGGIPDGKLLIEFAEAAIEGREIGPRRIAGEPGVTAVRPDQRGGLIVGAQQRQTFAQRTACRFRVMIAPKQGCQVAAFDVPTGIGDQVKTKSGGLAARKFNRRTVARDGGAAK